MMVSLKKMKIMQIIPTLGGGGAENMVLQLSYALKETYDVDITVVSLYDKNFAADGRIAYAEKNKISIVYLGKKTGFDTSLIRKLNKLIKSEKPDIIHTHLAALQYVLFVGLFHKINHIHTVHSIVGRENHIYEACFKIASKREMTSFVALTPAIEMEMKKIYNVRNDFLFCIPNGVDVSKYKNLVKTKNKQNCVFVCVGSLIPVKNHELLIKAFKEICEIRNYQDMLLIVGDGELRIQLMDMVASQGLKNNTVFTGNVSNVEDYLNDSDVFVLCSRYEGVSLALLEAAACGLPIIATATGGTPEIVQNDALLIPDNDLQKLCDAMLNFAEDVAKRKNFSETSRKIAERYSIQKMVESYYHLYMSKCR